MRSRAAWSAGWPRISIVPASGPRMFITIRSVVVLPAPFGPSRPKTLWRGTTSERSSTATWPAKAFRMPLSTRALSFNGASWLSRFPYEKAAGGVPPRDGRVTCGPRRPGCSPPILYSRPSGPSPRRSARPRGDRAQHARLRRPADLRQGRLRGGCRAAAAARVALPDSARLPGAPRTRPASAAARAPSVVGNRLRLRLQLDRLLHGARRAAPLRDGARALHVPGDRG